jgi:acyl-CoA thioesterase
MPKKFPSESQGFHPFGELIGLSFSKTERGYSECVLEVKEKLLNPHKVVHDGVISTMASTGMGGPLYPYSDEDELCAAIKTKVTYFVAVASGVLTCKTKLIHKGKRIAALESEIESDGRLVAKATGTYSIFGGKGD